MTMSPEPSLDLDPRALVDELFRAFNEHDVDRIMALHTPDAVWEDPTLPTGAIGRAAIGAHIRAVLRSFPDLAFDQGPELYEDGRGGLVARWRFSGTMSGPLERPSFAPTGRRASVSGVCVYRFSEGRIARHQQYYDALGLLEQLGLVPTPESAPARLAVGVQRAAVRVARGLHRAA